MKKSVGLVAMVRVPKDDSRTVLMAVLQRRGQWSTEKGEPESFPGCVQVTCHGSLEGEEDFTTALIRETEEELGENFASWLVNNLQQLTILSRVDTNKKQVITYGVFIPLEVMRDIYLGPDTGGLYWVTAEQMSDANTDLVTIDGRAEAIKALGPIFARSIVMFPDEIEAVRKAFEIYG